MAKTDETSKQKAIFDIKIYFRPFLQHRIMFENAYDEAFGLYSTANTDEKIIKHTTNNVQSNSAPKSAFHPES